MKKSNLFFDKSDLKNNKDDVFKTEVSESDEENKTETEKQEEKTYTKAEFDKLIEDERKKIAEEKEELNRNRLELQAKSFFKENGLNDKIIPYLNLTDEKSLKEALNIIRENYGNDEIPKLSNAHPVSENYNFNYNSNEIEIRKSMGLI